MIRTQPHRRSIVLSVALGTTLVAVAATAPATSATPRPARLDPKYTIGFQGPLSGANAQLGRNELKGVKLAIAQANAGSLPFHLALATADDQGDPVHAPAAALMLINNPEIRGVVGPSFSGASLASGGEYQSAHLAIVSPSATNVVLSHQGWRVFHRVVPSDPIEGMFAADWLKRRGVHRMFVVQDRSSYGLSVGNAVTREARAKRIHVTYVARDGVTTTDYGPLARRIVSSGVHTVYYAGYDVSAALLANALARAGYTGVRVSGNGVFSSAFTGQSGAAGNGWYVTCGCMTKYATPAQRAFATAYRAKFHQSPALYSAQAYDATNAIIRAIKKAVAAGHTGRPAINSALGNVDFHGVSTLVKFAHDGDVALAAARVNLFQDRHRAFAEIGDIRLAH